MSRSSGGGDGGGMDKGGDARRLGNKAIGDRLSCGIDGLTRQLI